MFSQIFIILTICERLNRVCAPVRSIIPSLFMVYTGYRGTSEIEHGLCACAVDNPLAKARGLSFRTGAQTMFYLTCTTITSVDLAHYGVSRAKDCVTMDCGTIYD